MSEASEPLDDLAQEFLARRRAGEPISVDDFAALHAAHRGELKELLPTLLALETVKQDRESGSGQQRASVPQLQRLGDFRILSELGRGGMGVVFEAVQESLGRKVALKVLPQAALLNERQLARFRREAQIAAQLHHSHIVPVFGSGESDGYQWYAMQYIAGQSLDQWRAAESQQVPQGSGAWRNRARFVARIGAEAASALHYAHGHGTLHRDIKPANLLLDNDGHVWVTDFGLAKALEEEGLTHSGDLLGTLQYLAPEQFAGQYDARSEVYALGITLYELLALRHAHAARTRSELLETIRSKSPTDLRRLCPDLPIDLILIVEKAMARDPGDRYATAGAFAGDLRAFLDDRAIAARRMSPLGVLVRWCKRNRLLAALSAAVVVLTLGGGAYGWTLYGITNEALLAEREAKRQTEQQSARAEANLQLSLAAFSNVFDALVGRDPLLTLDEDPETGADVVIAPSLRPQNVALLEQMLQFYDAFAKQNDASQSLRLDTARAYRRVAAIQSRLGKLDEAANSYERSLRGYQAVADRDVLREQANVRLDFGQVEQRRQHTEQAAAQYRMALDLLRDPKLQNQRALQLDQAKAHYLLARAFEFRGGIAARPMDQDGARAHLETARRIAAELRAADATDPEAKAMEARCLCSMRGRERRDGSPGSWREWWTRRGESFATGLSMFRELVVEYPNNEAWRFELCGLLAGDPRRLLQMARPAPEDRRWLEAEIAAWREAKQHVEHLQQLQPEVLDYLALSARVQLGLGTMLWALLVLGGADSESLRQEAAALLRATLATHAQLASKGMPSSGLMFVAELAARHQLAQLEFELGDAAASKTLLREMFAALLDAVDQRQFTRLLDRGAMDGVGRLVDRLNDPGLVLEFLLFRELVPVREERPPEGRGR